MPNDVLSTAELSDVVGAIYDCALDPTLWPDAIREVCRVCDFAAGTIDVSDLSSGVMLLHQQWNYDDALETAKRYGADVAQFWANVPNLATRPLDEPVSVMRVFPKMMETRYYHEWVRPRGYIDAVCLMVMRERDRLGALSLSRHESAGHAADQDLQALQLLAPHVRRAVAIGGVLHMRALKIGTIERALDAVQAGVILVDADCRIIHANRAAAAMLAKGAPVQTANGELRTYLPQTTAALKKAVAVAAEPSIGGFGIGIPLPQPDGEPAHIHVLPLMTGETRSRLAPRAAAALFVTEREAGTGLPAEAIAAVFGLTPAEIRTVERLLAGRSAIEIAGDLGLAVPTVRTHLANIYAKTGAERQADVIRLAAQLAGPARRAVGPG
jgi:DNA-binding CsgD family transcriptional regulator